jgi:hypothetical protein
VALRISTLPLVYDRAPLNSHRVPYFGTFAGLSCGSQGALGIVGEAEDARGVRVGGVEAQEDGVILFHLITFKPSIECAPFEPPRLPGLPARYRTLSGELFDLPQADIKISVCLL